MLRIAIALTICVMISLPVMPSAAGPSGLSGLEAGERGVVVEVVDGDTLFLDNGLQVRLVGIQAPKLPLGRPNFRKWPLADEAKTALESLAMGRLLQLSYGGSRRDRYGRALAHLHDIDGLWIQGELLRRGWARVYSFRDNRAAIPQMLALEEEARRHRRGIWGLEWYRILTPDEAGRRIGSFQLVEGRVMRADLVRGRLYVNFGADWRTDFTISVEPRNLRSFDAAGFDYAGLAGRLIRVRGWLKEFNGPAIRVTHPEQIELLSDQGDVRPAGPS
jgi:micrococcal nuclease